MMCFKWPTKFCTTLHGGYDDLPAVGIGYLLNVQYRAEDGVKP